MSLLKRVTVFDIVKEAEGDEAAADATGQDPAPNNTNTDQTQDQNNTENNDQESVTGDEDLDTALNDIDDAAQNGPDENTDDLGGDDLGGGMDNSSTSSSSSEDQNTEEEVNDDNTDIFSSLTAEEQKIKIKEQKNAFKTLYANCDDSIDKFNNLDDDLIDREILKRVQTALITLKDYIRDYIIYQYPLKSYIENDIYFNRFCANFDAISSIIESFYTNKSDKN